MAATAAPPATTATNPPKHDHVFPIPNNEAPGSDMGLTHMCARCMKNPGNKHCSGCKNVHYCSRECQVADWQDHKEDCRRRSELLQKQQDHKHKEGDAAATGCCNPAPAVKKPQHAVPKMSKSFGTMEEAESICKQLLYKFLDGFVLSSALGAQLVGLPLSEEARVLIQRITLLTPKVDEVMAFVMPHCAGMDADATLKRFCNNAQSFFREDWKAENNQADEDRIYIGPVSFEEISNYKWMRLKQSSQFFTRGHLNVILVVNVCHPTKPATYVMPLSKERTPYYKALAEQAAKSVAIFKAPAGAV